MSDPLHTATLVAAISAFVVFMFAGFPAFLGLRNGYAGPRRRRPAQDAALREMVRGHSGATLPIDWMQFPDLHKHHIEDIAAESGWRYAGEDFTAKEWWLLFNRAPNTPYEGPAERLTRELATAEGDTYTINALRYAALGKDGFNRVLSDAGWHPNRLWLRDALPITRAVELTEMPHNPAVTARAQQFANEHGYNPLDPERLMRLRDREAHWRTKNVGCWGTLLVVVCLVVGPLIIALGISDLARDSAQVITLCVGGGVTAIALAFLGYERWFTVQERKDIGDHQAILKELTKLHKETRPGSTGTP